MVFCTLFNSKYLDRGLVLFDSLKATLEDFKLYILCMDDLCAEILEKHNEDKIITVRLSEFETPVLKEIKTNRSVSEYFWTCTPLLIRYVLEERNEKECTYLDADMFFYSNPSVLLEEMEKAGKSVMFVPHNFAKRLNGKEKVVGQYCVEFNPFTKSEDSLMVLNEWANCCIESCGLVRDGKTFGDQKYLDALSLKFDNIHICKNNGAGIAPWNIDNFSLDDDLLRDRDGNECIPVFFHFQGIKFYEGQIDIDVPANLKSIDYKVVDYFYKPYINFLLKKRKELKAYNIDFVVDYSSRFKQNKIKNIIRRIMLKIPFIQGYLGNNVCLSTD